MDIRLFFCYNLAMQRRLFIAISVPENIKKRVFRLIEREYENLPVRWVRPENFHLTLNFLGYVPEEKIPEICKSLEAVASDKPAFDIDFTEICVGPTEAVKKMIWVKGGQNNSLDALRYSLDRELHYSSREKNKFIPHLTFGRIKRTLWNKLKPQPQIEREFKFLLPVSNVDLMESRYEKGKRTYYCLASFVLNG
ncbi:MAG: RNA 2',3'-cyclic phosphodiesterase [Parcubacteria group bacterium]|jgi:2'-5' RNA ligase